MYLISCTHLKPCQFCVLTFEAKQRPPLTALIIFSAIIYVSFMNKYLFEVNKVIISDCLMSVSAFIVLVYNIVFPPTFIIHDLQNLQ
jgi:hypothetical protein